MDPMGTTLVEREPAESVWMDHSCDCDGSAIDTVGPQIAGLATMDERASEWRVKRRK